MTLRAIVFDLDDTLAAKCRDRQVLLDEVAEELGVASLSAEAYAEAYPEVETDDSREPIFDAIIDDGSASPERVAEAYRAAVNDALEPVDDAERLLSGLAEGSDYRVGLLTDGPPSAQRGKVERLEWGDYFDAVVVTGELGTSKPDPVTFETVLERLGVSPDEAMYVGDKPETDIAGASDAGMTAVQVRYDGGPGVHPTADAAIDRESLAADLRSVLADRS